MRTHLPQNQFITHSAPARTSPGAGDAAAMRPPPVPAAADFPNPTMPTVGSAVPSDLPPVIGGTAAPFDEPSMTNGGDQEAIAGSAPNTAAPAIALDFDWRAFWDFITDERIVLFEPFDEHPLFVIEDGRLQRKEA